EATATWTNLVNGIQADDIEAAATATSTLVGPLNAYVSVDVTEDIKLWQLGTVNRGWALLPREDNGWDFDSSENLTTNRRPQLSIVYGLGIAPSDTSGGTLPADAVVAQGADHTLAASFDGLPTPNVQWYKDTIEIPGAVGTNYTIVSMSAADAGNYFARATNTAGSEDSRIATIGYAADVVQPTLITIPPNEPRLRGDGKFVFTFSESMDPAVFSALGVQIYPVGGSAFGDNLGLGSFTLENLTNFVVTTTTPAADSVSYLLTMFSGTVRDLAGNSNASITAQPITGTVTGPILLSGIIFDDNTISLTFNEGIDSNLLVLADISIYPTADDPDADNLGVQSAVVLPGLSELLLTTTTPPVPGTQYSARILEGAAPDTNGTANVQGTVPLNKQLVILPAGSIWKYLDDGSDQGTAWRAPAFNDSTWASGPAQLGYGDGDEATVVNFGIATNKFITTYFRTTVQIDNPAEFEALTVRLMRDDGAVVYLNGVEVVRDRMLLPPATIQFDTFADLPAVNNANESAFNDFITNATAMVSGLNTLAVEMHQASITSSDISFDLVLLGSGPALTGSAPGITLHPLPATQTLPEGSNVTFTAAADGFPPPSLYWELDDGTGFQPIAGATNATLSIDPVLPSHSGNYRAVATNFAGVAFSDPAQLTITDDTIPPLLLSASGDEFSVYLTFSRNLGPTGATIGNYTLQQVGGGGALTITNVVATNNLVTLQHTEPQPPGLYEVVVSNVSDTTENPNFIAPNPSTLTYSSDLPIIPIDGVWSYLDDGSDQGTAWRAPGFNDITWTNGPAELGYGDGDEATLLSFGPSDTNKITTTYFRKTFTVADPTAFTNFIVNLHYDDGAVTYLNGIEINRVNMTNELTNPIRFNHFANRVNATDDRIETFNLRPNQLLAGDNTFAIEIHQGSLTSSDISLSLIMTGQTGEFIPDIVLGLPGYLGGDVILYFDGPGDLYIQESESLVTPLWATLPGGPHVSPLNIGPVDGRGYFRVTNTP
ncbi:MAG: hypothetical protein ACI9TH_001585, partial [Kiritimatiellia bacterium]